MSKLLSFLARLRRGDDLRCPEMRGLSSEYLEGSLPGARQAAVRRHLEWCGPCRAFIATLKATVALLRALPTHQAPPSLKERVLKHLR